MYCGPEDVGAIVADIGTYATRIGFAGEDAPKAIGVVGHDSSRNYVFDTNARKENMSIQLPMKDGLIEDWDLYENMWDFATSKYLRVSLRDMPVLVAEKPYNPPAHRHRLAEVMFEKYNASAFFLAKDSVLSCYACGRTTGLVVDVGASGTTVSPVQDGWVEARGVMASVVGGRTMDAHVSAILSKKGVKQIKSLFRFVKVPDNDAPKGFSFHENTALKNVHPAYDAWMNLELCRDVKEAVCRTADGPLSDDPRFTNLPLIYYELPDGTVVDVGVERFQLPELLMDPSALQLDRCKDYQLLYGNPTKNPLTQHSVPFSYDPLPKLIQDSAIRCDLDIQPGLLSNMILTGGGSGIEGLSERIRTEVEKLVHPLAPAWKIKTLTAGTNERAVTSWIGGSILGSLGSFHEMWISKDEFREYGASIVDRKCP